MDITVKRDDFLKAVKAANSSTGSLKDPFLCLSAKDGILDITSFSSTIYLKSQIKFEGSGKEKIHVDISMLVKALSSLEKGIEVGLEFDLVALSLFAGNFSMKIPRVKNDFVKLSVFGGEEFSYAFSVDFEEFCSKVNGLLSGVASESFSKFSVVFSFTLQKNKLILKRTDGYVIAQDEISVDYLGDTVRFCLNNTDLTGLLRAFATQKRIDVKNTSSNRKTIFEGENIKICMVHMLDFSQFDCFDSLFFNAENVLFINKEEFKNSVEKCNCIYTRSVRVPITKLTLEDKKLEISCYAPAVGSRSKDEIKVCYFGEKIEKQFNSQFLLRALSSVRSELIEVSFNKTGFIQLKGSTEKYMLACLSDPNI